MQSLDAGLVLTPAALVLLVLMPVAGRIYDAIGPRYPVMLGLAVIAAASYQLAQLSRTRRAATSSCGSRCATSASGSP